MLTPSTRFFLLLIVVFAIARVPAQEVRSPIYDAQTRIDWHTQHLEMRSVSPFKDLKWKHIGPTLMSGRITDIAKPLDQPHTFYVASASGGVWKTDNEGTTWQPLFDFDNALGFVSKPM